MNKSQKDENMRISGSFKGKFAHHTNGLSFATSKPIRLLHFSNFV